MTTTTTTAEIADAIQELETYDDAEHRAVLDLVREILDQIAFVDVLMD